MPLSQLLALPFNSPYLFLLFHAAFHQIATAEVMLAEPKIVYMDGPLDNCRAGLKQSVEATTGLLLSHPFYGSLPYNASRNCFLTVVVPLGYRIRLKALDFDVQGQWGKCEHEDTFHIFDFNQPLDPSALDAVESSLPVGGDPTSPLLGRILGQYCGKTPKPKNDQSRHLVLAESSHNALILWWHTEEATKRKETAEEFAQQQKYQRERGGRHSTPMAFSFAQQGYRLLWSSFRLMPDSQCQNGSKEFQCGGPPAQSSTPSPTGSAVECIPAPLGCNSYADCADASDLDPQLQLRHGCDHIPNDPLSLLTSSGPKRLLLCAALVLLWLSLCFGFCCFLVHFRRQRIKKKKRCPAGTAGSQQQQQQQELISRNGHPKDLNGRQQTSNGGGQFQLGERATMPMVHQYSSSSGDRSATQMPPALPPPSFSPPAVPSNRPPPAPAAATIGGSGQMLNARQQQQQRQFQQHDQRQSASSSSHSSSQHQQQQQQKVPPPPPHLNSIGPNFGQQQQRANGGGEYFYVHQPPAAGGGGAALLLKSDRHRQQQQPMPPESRRHLLL